jgi:ABC-type glycerol-3-phosphate transport system permease component
VREVLFSVILAVILVLVLFPLVFMIVTSFKTNDELLLDFWGLPAVFHWDNYTLAWNQIAGNMLNTIVVAAASTVGSLICSSMAGYVFGRYAFPGRGLLFGLTAILLMVPGILTLIPRFMLVYTFGLLNTDWALILPYISGALAFQIYVLRTFFASLPQELFEAARVDGASSFDLYRHIALPLCMPMLATLAVLEASAVWNDLIWPLITISDSSRWTITPALAYLHFGNETLWGPTFAGYILGSIPLAALLAVSMRQFLAGLMSGSLKV